MKKSNLDEKIPGYSEQALLADVANLNHEISPERDLWSGIEKAINQPDQRILHTSQQKPNVLAPLSWAASVVIAVLATWSFLTPKHDELMSSVSLVAAMEQDFIEQKQTLLINLGAPDIKALPSAMQAELAKLKSAQATISKALAEDPNNSDLLNLLRWTQKQELDLLTQLYSPQWQTI